ncbi:MAG: DUF4388 domain-containing protein [Nitrospirae bacterium]|nr:DUF4388 domain-containing protein [Nitrospirota bacterium]
MQNFQRKTGILTLEGRMDNVRLLFYEGNVVSAESKRKTEVNRLGKLLIKKGLIRDEDLQSVLKEQQSTGVKIGNILIRNGLVQKEQLKDVIISQITETVVQLFNWKEGIYEFSPQGVPVDREIPISLDTQHLLMEGLRIMDEWSLVEGKLTLDTIFVKKERPKTDLTQDEEEILQFVDGESDVSVMLDASQMDNFQASKALVSLMEKGIIKPIEVAPVIVSPKTTATTLQTKKMIPLAKFVTTIVFLISIFVAPISLLFLKKDNIDVIKASEDIDGIRFRIEVYGYNNGSYPSAIELITKTNDRWGRPYIYRTEGDNFILFSAGTDGKEGTKDDVY